MLELLSKKPDTQTKLLDDSGFKQRPEARLEEDELWYLVIVEHLSFRFESEPMRFGHSRSARNSRCAS